MAQVAEIADGIYRICSLRAGQTAPISFNQFLINDEHPALIFAHEAPVRQVVNRVQKINPAWIHPMHGGSFKREIAPRYHQALREQPFAYDAIVGPARKTRA